MQSVFLYVGFAARFMMLFWQGLVRKLCWSWVRVKYPQLVQIINKGDPEQSDNVLGSVVCLTSEQAIGNITRKMNLQRISLMSIMSFKML